VSRKLIGGVVVVAVAIVAALVVFQLSGNDDGPSTSAFQESAPKVEEQLAGIPQDGYVLGKADAPVTLVEYVDVKCPFCALAATGVMKEVVAEYVRPGTVKVELRPIRLGSQGGQGSTLGPDSERGAFAVLAAADQDKMFNYADILFENQGDERQEWLTDQVVTDIATAAGLDVDAWRTSFEGDGVVDKLFANESAAQAAGYTGTPFYVATGPGGTKSFSESEDFEVFKTNIDEVAKER